MMGCDSCGAAEVVTQFTTPGGRPASSSTVIKARVLNGVCGAGLITTVHPAASAGAILRVPIASGKFHGVMANTGPTGCFSVTIRLPPDGARRKLPAARTPCSANQRRNSAP